MKYKLLVFFFVFGFLVSSAYAQWIEESDDEMPPPPKHEKKPTQKKPQKKPSTAKKPQPAKKPKKTTKVEQKKQTPSPVKKIEVKKKGSWFELINLAIGTTGVFQSSIGYSSGDYAATGSLDLVLSAPIADNGKAKAWLEVAKGSGIAVPSLFGWNADAAVSPLPVVFPHEMWYEHRFVKDVFSAAAGMIDLAYYFGTNKAASDFNTQFLSTGFFKSIAVERPQLQSFATMFWFTPNKMLTFGLAFSDADSDWRRIFDDIFAIFEFAVHLNFSGLEANYRLNFWYDDKDHTNHAATKNDLKGWGFGISADQQLSKSIMLFLRYSYEDSQIYDIAHYISLGAELSGALFGREKDALGVAVGIAIMSSDLTTREDEFHIEIYYRFQVNDWLGVSPDIQFASNPGGYNTDSAFVVGIRVYLLYN